MDCEYNSDTFFALKDNVTQRCLDQQFPSIAKKIDSSRILSQIIYLWMHVGVERQIHVPTFFPHWITQSGEKSWTWKLQTWKKYIKSHTRNDKKPSCYPSMCMGSSRILSKSGAHENIVKSRSQCKQMQAQLFPLTLEFRAFEAIASALARGRKLLITLIS